jgi:single-strand DNA-binding protein
MMNQIVMVGRLVSDPTIKENEDGKKVTNITLAVQRPYKNGDGEYETDFIDCVLWNGIAENTSEYCHRGDIVGIKGRIQNNNYEINGEKRKSTVVIAERVTFLTSKKENFKDNKALEV